MEATKWGCRCQTSTQESLSVDVVLSLGTILILFSGIVGYTDDFLILSSMSEVPYLIRVSDIVPGAEQGFNT